MAHEGIAWVVPRDDLHVIEDFSDHDEEYEPPFISLGDTSSRRHFCSPSPPRRQSSPSDQGSQERETEEFIQRRFDEYHATRRASLRKKVTDSGAGDFSAAHFRRVEEMLADYENTSRKISPQTVSDAACNGDGDHATTSGNGASDSRGEKRSGVSLEGSGQTANANVYQVRTAIRRIVLAEREAAAARRAQNTFVDAATSMIETRKRELRRLRREVARVAQAPDRDVRRVRLERVLGLTEVETNIILLLCICHIMCLNSITSVAEAKVKLFEENFQSCSPHGETKAEGLASSRPKPLPSDIPMPPPPRKNLLGMALPSSISAEQARIHVVYSQMRQIASTAAHLETRDGRKGKGVKRKASSTP